jgi:putative spermidine/putrescine transport system substrate-binding protein
MRTHFASTSARRLSGMAALAATLALCAAPGALAEDLRVATYGGAYMDAAKAAYWAPFQKDTGITIIGDTTDDSMGAIRALAEAPTAKWDVMEADMLIAGEACAEGLIKPIDKAMFPATMAPGTVTECGVTSVILGALLVVNRETYGAAKADTMGWAEYFDTRTYPGKRGMSRYVQQVAIAALLADGVAAKDIPAALREPGARDRIFKKLDPIKKDLVFYQTGTEFLQGLLSGEYSMAFGWNARINAANKESNNRFAARWQAGYSIGMNAFMIPANAPNPAAAMRYIASTAIPEREAAFMRAFSYSTPNTEAFALLTPPERALQPGNPDYAPFAAPEEAAFWNGKFDEWQQALEAWIAAG